MQLSHVLDVFLGGLITIAAVAIALTSKQTASIIQVTGQGVSGSLKAAEGQAA
jgi:hypothetical protein